MAEVIITNRPQPQPGPIVLSLVEAIEILSDMRSWGCTMFNAAHKCALSMAIAALIAERLNLER